MRVSQLVIFVTDECETQIGLAAEAGHALVGELQSPRRRLRCIDSFVDFVCARILKCWSLLVAFIYGLHLPRSRPLCAWVGAPPERGEVLRAH